jgi:ATP-dependent RNA helicase DDX24/MAK5
MIERGHFHELQSIIEMLPVTNGSDEQTVGTTPSCETVPILQIKKRQTFVFSATLALSANFRKKLKRGLVTAKASASTDLSSIEALSKQARMKPNAEIVDLTKASILPEKLEESFIEYVFSAFRFFGVFNCRFSSFYFSMEKLNCHIIFLFDLQV